MKARLAGLGIALALWLGLASMASAVPPGYDLFETDPQQTQFQFEGNFAIPPGFFDPGSAPFTGAVHFGGEQLGSFQGKDTGDADTVVQRKNGANLQPPFPGTDTVPIEIVALNLVSVEPFNVQVGGTTQEWDVKAQVSPSTPSQGQMTIIQTSDQGGTFSSQLLVLPLFTFTRTTDRATRTLDVGQQFLAADQKTQADFYGALQLNARDVPWSAGCSLPALAVPGLNDEFCPGFTGGVKLPMVEQALLAQHGVYTAQSRLEHFKCYGAKALKRFKARSVTLTDQFGSENAKVVRALELCNPVKKNKETLTNKIAHLKCYSIKDVGGSKFAQRAVWVRNQFGVQGLTVVKPQTLCLPSTKQLLSKRLRPVQKKPKATELTDHFKCYKVTGTVKKTTVTLKDQFGTERPKVLKPVQLCAPVQKNDTKIQHPVRHLVCYALREPRKKRGPLNRFVRVRNQFGTENLRVTKPKKLCVPSTKVLAISGSGSSVAQSGVMSSTVARGPIP